MTTANYWTCPTCGESIPFDKGHNCRIPAQMWSMGWYNNSLIQSGTTDFKYWQCPNCKALTPMDVPHVCKQPQTWSWDGTALRPVGVGPVLERIAKALEEIAHPEEKAEEQSNDWAGEAARLVMVELTDFHALNIGAIGPQYSNRQDAIVRALKKVILSTYKRAHDGR